jgi:hypothetical protein
LITYAIGRSYVEKVNKINGLRRTRVYLLILLIALIIDNSIFAAVSISCLITGNPVIQLPVFIALIDKLIVTTSLFGLYHLFRHATQKETRDRGSKMKKLGKYNPFN